MFNYDRFAKVATATVGALVLSTLSIGAAIGPAAAQSRAPAAQAQVSA